MKKSIINSLQLAAVFIGTIVGAGLASGKEIANFFTLYGFNSYIGIFICCIFYIIVGNIFSTISINHNLKSYSDLIDLVSPDLFGKIMNISTSFFLLSGAAVIMAGSGALFNQFFGVSRWIGIGIIAFFSIIVLMKETEGLIDINSVIVPILIIVLSSIFAFFILFPSEIISITKLKSIPVSNNNWLISSLIYAGFNILCCSGIIISVSSTVNNKKAIFIGITLGSVMLMLLCSAINIMLMMNVPYIHNYEIPLLYISHRFGNSIQIILLTTIWLEMFSTVISDIYSVSKMIQSISNSRTLYLSKYTLKPNFIDRLVISMSYKKSIFVAIILALPISQIGFSNLIKILYPSFGVISLFFIVKCIYFYFKNISNMVK